jgi:hypothetical protein
VKRGFTVRALLLKPAALGAAIGLGLFGIALLAFGSLVVDAPTAAAQSSDCASPPTASPSPSASSSASPSPSSSASPSAPSITLTPELCVLVQSYPSDGDVLAGDSASYTVLVWSLTADSSDVSVTASVTAASYLGTPGYTICPSASGSTCTIASLSVGDVDQLLATVPVTNDATPDTDIELTVSATSSGASSDSDSATDVVVAPTSATSNSSTSSTSGSSTGSDDTSSTVPPLESLPSIPGTGVTATDPTDLFPTVSPSTTTQPLGLPPAKVHHVVTAAETAYAVPVDPRLLGAQIVGLVALAGAITIAIVRLSLRKPLPSTTGPADPTDKTVAS